MIQFWNEFERERMKYISDGKINNNNEDDNRFFKVADCGLRKKAF